MTVGQRIKELRKEKRLTQREFAQLFNVNHSTLAMWETDKNQPDIDTLKKLAVFFNISVDYLVSNTDEWGESIQVTQTKTPPPLTDQEREALELFRVLNPKDRSKILTALEVYADAEIARQEQNKKGG